MQNLIAKALGAGACAALLALVPTIAPAAAVTIQVNGSTVSFDQAPIERSGRVYVPLRGVFERLGASVVYSNRVINATGNGHNVNLRIGSSTATVDGNNVGLDSPPFLVGSRTLVPLRFVAQALGATVNYNNGTRVVSINSSGANAGSSGNNGNSGTATNNAGTVTLTNLSVPNGAVIASNAPTISGNFSEAVNPNSVRIHLDNRDITNMGTYVGSDSFQFTLPTLPPGQHTVTVSGNAATGGAFSQSITFRSGADVSKPFVSNVEINGVGAANGQQVPSTYTVTGSTIPNATVQIVIGYQTSLLNGLIPLGANTNSQTVTADGNGRFSANVNSSVIGSPQQYTLVLRAINPQTQAASDPVQYTVHT